MGAARLQAASREAATRETSAQEVKLKKDMEAEKHSANINLQCQALFATGASEEEVRRALGFANKNSFPVIAS
jgi:hypothetical protein